MTKLNSLFVANVKTPGRYYDGNGLYLLVQKNRVNGIRKSWVLRFASPITRRRRDLGLRGTTTIGLAEVRKQAVKIRSEIQSGADPLANSAHHRIHINSHKQNGYETSFEVIARNFHSTHSLTLKNEKYRQQWINNLERCLFKDLGDTSIEQIKANHLATLVQPLAIRIPDTTRKIVGQLDLIFRDCVARDLIEKNAIDKC
jgi:Arm DNA-binding domain